MALPSASKMDFADMLAGRRWGRRGKRRLRRWCQQVKRVESKKSRWSESSQEEWMQRFREPAREVPEAQEGRGSAQLGVRAGDADVQRFEKPNDIRRRWTLEGGRSCRVLVFGIEPREADGVWVVGKLGGLEEPAGVLRDAEERRSRAADVPVSVDYLQLFLALQTAAIPRAKEDGEIVALQLGEDLAVCWEYSVDVGRAAWNRQGGVGAARAAGPANQSKDHSAGQKRNPDECRHRESKDMASIQDSERRQSPRSCDNTPRDIYQDIHTS